MGIMELRRIVVLLAAVAVAGSACSAGGGRSATTTGGPTTVRTEQDIRGAEGGLQLTSDAFGEGDAIPARFSRNGGNQSPPLAWTAVPQGTVEFALVVDDPDAPGGTPFVHWLVAGIAPVAGSMAAGQLVAGAVEGRNGFGTIGWGGPAPPSGQTHHYRFTLEALSSRTGLARGFTRAQLDAATGGRVLATAVLTGVYPGR